MDTLTSEDFDILIDAVDAWDTKDVSDHLSTMLLGTMLSASKEDAKAFIEEESAKANSQADMQKAKHEKSILLKAKLIQLRDKMLVKEVLS